MDNEVNTNIVNSEFINHTLNIYLSDGVGDVDLNLLAQNAVAKVYGEDQNLGETVSVTAYSIDNFAYVENNIEAEADTGGNEIDSSGEGEISTGNAYSSTSVLNKVNTNVVNSQIHIITINIFGSLTGNIILPSSGGLSQEGCCQASIVSENVAIVVNNVSGQANTGQNQIVSSGGEAEIETGNAKVAVNVYNLVNTNIVNSYFNYFEINNMGEWSGSFLGWNENQAPPQNQSCDGCTGDLSLGNSAEVVNNVSSSANTGENSINGGGAKIKTGNAYAGISIVNLVNTNIINSVGFIGFINIFGRLLGDVGGSQYFSESIEIPEETEDVTEVQASQESQEPSQKESGGTLEVSHSHNVGTHVLPGDTVTFFAKVKNPGTLNQNS
ncbi:MAG: hypothetical protein UX13_C0015G0008 [Candidatus Woesebacteria bacterium GW2011_GWB1_45_5]|uniref:Uncharacterized protein n=1 Tax=Candidatus Woesebacteria bacterium GW2011_GWB1_45_5 TaxID=1618581 RepID=A0A0G1MQ38_9BACT|nr:MAG: hypothetical protein UX13_C0015G0008 [Candidatus Woesebacteria bacterium GW2011_GWB1_45_5]